MFKKGDKICNVRERDDDPFAFQDGPESTFHRYLEEGEVEIRSEFIEPDDCLVRDYYQTCWAPWETKDKRFQEERFIECSIVSTDYWYAHGRHVLTERNRSMWLEDWYQKFLKECSEEEMK